MAAQSVSVLAEPTIGSVDDALAHVIERGLTPGSSNGRAGRSWKSFGRGCQSCLAVAE